MDKTFPLSDPLKLLCIKNWGGMAIARATVMILKD
jgi:hypothetical protein